MERRAISGALLGALVWGAVASAGASACGPSRAELVRRALPHTEPARLRGEQWRAALPVCSDEPVPEGRRRVEGRHATGMGSCTLLLCERSLCCNHCRFPASIASDDGAEAPLFLPEGPLRELYGGSDGLDCEMSAWARGADLTHLRLRMTWRPVNEPTPHGRRVAEDVALCRVEGR